jgi:ABC-type sugar transport system ATPase subunit
MGRETVLIRENINKSFGGVPVLKDVSFELFAGEIHALVGENGAGKSTLMKILMGVYQYDSGKYIVAGEEVRFSSPAEAQKKRVSMIYQEFGLVPYLSVTKNVLLGRMPLRAGGLINWAEARRQARYYLDMVESHQIPTEEIVSNLSMSDQQEVAIARALSYDPVVLVMDEPTSALSLGEMERLYERMRILRDRGVAIVYISHKLDEVFRIADRVTIIRDGTIVATDNINDIDAPTLIEKITGRKAKKALESEATRTQTSRDILKISNFSVEGLFSDINLTVRKHEIVGVAGLIGAGKTELAKAICGVLPKAHRVTGEYIFDGKKVEITSLNPSCAKKMGIGFVTENRLEEGMMPAQSLLFNLTLPSLSKVSRRFVLIPRLVMAMTIGIIERVIIQPSEPRKTMRLFSGGNQQKAVIGKWLATEPKLLILDEPTRGVDVGARQEIYEVIREQVRHGAGVLLLSSDLREIMEVSDRILVMRHGRIVGEAMRQQMSQERLVELVFGQEDVNNNRK